MYKIINIINNKLYIGLTYFTIEHRFKQHIYRATKDKKYQHLPLYKAMNKYGISNFIIRLIGEFEEGKLEEMERFYIKKYNTYGHNGYNATFGGEGIDTFKYTDEEIIKTYNKIKTIKGTSFTLKCNPEAISKRLIRNNIKTNNFNKFSLSEIAKKYYEFKDVKKVADYFGYCNDTIRHKLDILNIDYRRHKHKRHKIDSNYIIEEYNNGIPINEIATKLNISEKTIRYILKQNNIAIDNYLINHLKKDDILNYYFKTKSLVKTASFFNLDRNSLSRYLHDNKINIANISKNTPIKIGIIIDNRTIEFDSIFKCTEFLINNNLTKNKSVRGIRDAISKAIKNNNTYLGYYVYKIN